MKAIIVVSVCLVVVAAGAVEEPRDTDVGPDETVRSPSEEGIDGRLARRQQGMADAI
jgi:hypothetical protein